MISDFKSQLANQAATRTTREYAIPVPEEHVNFSFIEYVSALHLTSDDKKSIIGNLREQLLSTGFIYEERVEFQGCRRRFRIERSKGTFFMSDRKMGMVCMAQKRNLFITRLILSKKSLLNISRLVCATRYSRNIRKKHLLQFLVVLR